MGCTSSYASPTQNFIMFKTKLVGVDQYDGASLLVLRSLATFPFDPTHGEGVIKTRGWLE